MPGSVAVALNNTDSPSLIVVGLTIETIDGATLSTLATTV